MVPSLAPGSPDFSATVAFGHTVFGLVAFRRGTYVLYGDDFAWLPLPSWAAGVAFLLLATVEWLAFRLFLHALRSLARARLAPRASAPE